MQPDLLEHLRILAVDDEPTVLQLYRDILSPAADFYGGAAAAQCQPGAPARGAAPGCLPPLFDLHTCAQGEEAVETVGGAVGAGRPFAVAFIDIVMPPGPDGVWTAEQCRKLDPDLEIVMVTAHAIIDPQEIAVRVPPVDKLLYVQKPIHPEEIRHFALALGTKWQGERELHRIQAELEERVEQRTTALVKLNRLLERDVVLRRQAEQKLQQTLEKLRRAMGGIIQAMALTVERRDPYTAGHQRRVADLARALGTEMGLTTRQIDGIRMAGLIHDLGKICVPGEILNKPGPLSDIELTLIKSHPQVGYEILKEIEFPWPVARIVLQHHERLDGSGYPAGLTAGDILLEARTLAVADVVEAMASHRPYRATLGIDKALEEVSKNKGTLYDAVVVDACLSLFTRKGFQFRH